MDASIAGEVLAALGGMAGTAKAIFETITIAKKNVKNAEATGRLETALTEIRSLQLEFGATEEKVRSLNREILRLEEKNSALRSEKRALIEEHRKEKERLAERERYKLKKFGKSVVLVHEDYPGSYFCPACLQVRGQVIPLQPIDHGDFNYHCFTCHTPFTVRGDD